MIGMELDVFCFEEQYVFEQVMVKQMVQIIDQVKSNQCWLFECDICYVSVQFQQDNVDIFQGVVSQQVLDVVFY